MVIPRDLNYPIKHSPYYSHIVYHLVHPIHNYIISFVSFFFNPYFDGHSQMVQCNERLRVHST